MPTVKEVRSAYEGSKRAYHKAGKAAMGKAAGSAAQKVYKSAKREYHALGKMLGKLTKKKDR